MSLMDMGRNGYDDTENDCGCGGDAECPSPECVAGREAAAEQHSVDPDEYAR